MRSTHAQNAGIARPDPGSIFQPLRRLGLNAQQAYALSGVAVLLALWAAGTHFLAGGLPLAASLAPGATFQSLYELVSTGQLTSHTAMSLQRVLVGLALALLIGVPVGLAVGGSRTLENASGTAFQFLRMISPLSWMPIAVMVFGIGDAPIYFLLTFAAVWPIMLNTAAGVRQLDPKWLMLAKSLSATRREVLFRIVVPGILGNVLTGVRLAIGIIWIVLVPCEMLGVSSGLGYYILDTRDRLAYSELMAVIVLIGALGFLLDGLAQRAYRHWSRGAR
ncbi:ABC transporter permease [Parapusillimonas granuli]|uniref:ABC transporter permease n=1 Tax=Parapusillimonas granuli TaxID=380911 RepID=A0A853FZT2_9BURK|nr:ABC transporter permease [Parapusillimonas granuli]MBB5215280.1 NitT/TauT family transport system permease protein [Parapusillimonas granuli]MEB2398385.1 ABC transporter permease [Alcaligenaceae bacterium]NYT49597.1 ABC transporter permease [Parapusillimonas granuli]